MVREFYVKTEEDVERLLSVPYVPPRPPVSGFFELDRKVGERGIVLVSFAWLLRPKNAPDNR